MTKFAAYLAARSEIDFISSQIMAIFVAKNAIDDLSGYFDRNKKMPEFFHQDQEEFGPSNPDLVTIKCSYWLGNEEEMASFNVPLAWYEDFNPIVVEAYAEAVVARRDEEKAARAQAEKNKTDAAERAKLAELIAKHPDMAAKLAAK